MGKVINYRSFEEARAYARQLQLKNQTEWRNWAKTEEKPDDIPAQPAHVYKDKGWSSWGEWLGTDYVANQNRTYLPYEEARTYVHQLQFKNGKAHQRQRCMSGINSVLALRSVSKAYK